MNVPRMRYSALVPVMLLILASPAFASGCGGNSEDAQDLESNVVAQSAPDQTPPAGQVPENAVDLSDIGFNEGDEDDAVVAVIEFSDYGCVFCARFHEDTFPALNQEFIQGGDILWKYIPISIAGFPNGDLAAIAGQCGGEIGAFAEMRDHLYEHREEWMASDRGNDLFVEYGEAVGIDRVIFRECVESGDARARIEENNRIAAQIGVEGTPTFIVQGMPVRGAPALNDFQTALRQLVAEVRGQATP